MNANVEKILLRLESIHGREAKFWNVPRPTGIFLNHLTRLCRMKTVLEIGTSNGYSGLWIAEALSHTGGMLYTVESHAGRFQMARDHFLEAGILNFVTQMKGHAPEIFGSFILQDVDMVFLDATKHEHVSYIQAVLPMLSFDGIIVADNFLTHAADFESFKEQIEAISELECSLFPLDNGLFIMAKKPVS